MKTQNDAYRTTWTERLLAESLQHEIVLSPDMENVKGAKWRLASSLAVQTQMDSCVLESDLHAAERVPAEGRGKSAQFIPIRFLFSNKLNKDDKLLLALDAFVLSKSLGREISVGKIIQREPVRNCPSSRRSRLFAIGLRRRALLPFAPANHGGFQDQNPHR